MAIHIHENWAIKIFSLAAVMNMKHVINKNKLQLRVTSKQVGSSVLSIFSGLCPRAAVWAKSLRQKSCENFRFSDRSLQFLSKQHITFFLKILSAEASPSQLRPSSSRNYSLPTKNLYLYSFLIEIVIRNKLNMNFQFCPRTLGWHDERPQTCTLNAITFTSVTFNKDTKKNSPSIFQQTSVARMRRSS